MSEEFVKAEHEEIDHIVEGTPRNMAKVVLARHLCGWISGHSAPLDHFLVDAEMILADIDAFGLKVIRNER